MFGATGGVGAEIVRQALTAVVRDPSRLSAAGAGLEVFRADLTGSEAVRAAVSGRDAVLSGIGARKKADAQASVATTLTRSVVQAMEAEGVRRLVVVSAAPVGPPAEPRPAVDRMMGSLVSRILRPPRLQDSR